MKKILIASLFALSATTAFAAIFPPIPGSSPSWGSFGTEGVSAGTVCQVKDIHVLTASPEDCATIGGEATHTLTQSAKPITK